MRRHTSWLLSDVVRCRRRPWRVGAVEGLPVSVLYPPTFPAKVPDFTAPLPTLPAKLPVFNAHPPLPSPTFPARSLTSLPPRPPPRPPSQLAKIRDFTVQFPLTDMRPIKSFRGLPVPPPQPATPNTDPAATNGSLATPGSLLVDLSSHAPGEFLYQYAGSSSGAAGGPQLVLWMDPAECPGSSSSSSGSSSSSSAGMGRDPPGRMLRGYILGAQNWDEEVRWCTCGLVA